MRTRARLRVLADYLAATRNEIAVDEMFLSLSGINTSHFCYFPRVPRWIRFAKHYPSLATISCRVAKIVWLCGGAATFFLLEFLKYSFFFQPIYSRDTSGIAGLNIGFSERAYDVIKSETFPTFPHAWLVMPWAPQKSVTMRNEGLQMLSVITRSDLWTALVDALTITYRMRHNRNFALWNLQSYTAFRWFLARRAIDHCPGYLVMAEHFDRWAILADRAMREKRRLSNFNGRLVLVQHGALGPLNNSIISGLSIINLPTRLSQVDELHVYNKNEAALFKSYVLSKTKDTHALDLQFFKPQIELTCEFTSGKIGLLFVGHPLCEHFQAALFQEFSRIGRVEIFYKPHPKSPASPAMSAVGWKMITEEKFFPKVDLLISYPSTLVIEYAGAGIPASVHPIDARIDDLPLFVEKTWSLIGERNILNRGAN